MHAVGEDMVFDVIRRLDERPPERPNLVLIIQIVLEDVVRYWIMCVMGLSVYSMRYWRFGHHTHFDMILISRVRLVVSVRV